MENPELEYRFRRKRFKQVCQQIGDFASNANSIQNQLLNPSRFNRKAEPSIFLSPTANFAWCELTKCSSSNWRYTTREIEHLLKGKKDDSKLLGELRLAGF